MTDTEDVQRRGHRKQVVATFFVTLWHLNDGACVSISSTILYSLERGSEGIMVSLDEATLVPILFLIGNIIGSFASGWISASFGRKRTMLWSGLPLALSWLSMGLSTNSTILYGSSFSQGLFTAFPWTSAGAYISETIEKDLRKLLSLCTSLQTSIGFVISYSLGYLIGWRLNCFVMVGITLMASLLILLLPETPYWLVEKERHEEAQKSLSFYRGEDNDKVREELQEIVDAKESKCNQSKKSFLGIVSSGEFWRPFSCVGILFILFRLSSYSILSHYTAPFLDKAHISLDPLLAAVIIGIIRLVSSLSAFVIFSYTSKRTAFILAGVASIFGMLLVAIHSHLSEALSPTPEWLLNMGWVPLVGFIIITLCLPIILGIILILIGELFPTDIRTVSIGTVRGMQYLALALATKLFPILSKWLHFYGLNYYYAAFALALTIWGMATIKDIDRLSLVEIEQIYDRRVVKSDNVTPDLKEEDLNK